MNRPERPKKPVEPWLKPREQIKQPQTIAKVGDRYHYFPGGRGVDTDPWYDEDWYDCWTEEETEKKADSLFTNLALNLKEIVDKADKLGIPLDKIYIGGYSNDDYFYVHAFHEKLINNPHFKDEEGLCKHERFEYNLKLEKWKKDEASYQSRLKEYLADLEQEAREVKRDID